MIRGGLIMASFGLRDYRTGILGVFLFLLIFM